MPARSWPRRRPRLARATHRRRGRRPRLYRGLPCMRRLRSSRGRRRYRHRRCCDRQCGRRRSLGRRRRRLGLWEAVVPTWVLRGDEGFRWPAACHTHHISSGSLCGRGDECSAKTYETTRRGRGARDWGRLLTGQFGGTRARLSRPRTRDPHHCLRSHCRGLGNSTAGRT